MNSEVSKSAMRMLIFLKDYKEARYSELLKALGLSSAGLTKILDKLVSKGIVLRELKPDRSVYYRLNEARIDEINELIRGYIDHEKRELRTKIEFITRYFTEKELKEFFEFIEQLKNSLEL